TETVYLLAADPNGDFVYDTFYLSSSKEELGEEVKLDEWGAMTLTIPGKDSAGFLFKVKGDGSLLDNLNVFQGTIMGGHLHGPEGFRETIVKQFGFYPSSDEIDAFQSGDLTREEYEEAGSYFIDWVTNVSLF